MVFTCKVTLAPAGMTRLRLVKAAVAPEKVVVPKEIPLLKSAIPVIAMEGVPEPESARVKLFTVTAEALGLLKRT